MTKSFQRQMLVLALVFMIFSYMTSATPMAIPTDPLVQDISVNSPTFSLSEIDEILKPRVSKALRMLLSQYKKVATDSGPIIYGKTASDAEETSSFLTSLLGRKYELGAEVDSFMEKNWEEVVKPVRFQFLIEANKIIHAAKEEARDVLADKVNSVAVIKDLVDALEPLDEFLRELVIDFIIESIPEMLKQSAEALIKAIIDELDSVINAEVPELLQVDEFRDLAKSMIREETITKLNASVPGMVEEKFKSLPNDVYSDPASARKLLEQFFLERMPGGASSLLQNVISGNMNKR